MTAPDRIWATPFDEKSDGGTYCNAERRPLAPNFDARCYIRADLVPQWMPIDTAPDFGVSFIGAYRTKIGTWIAEVVTLEARTITSSGKPFPATHWQPLPNPPPAT